MLEEQGRGVLKHGAAKFLKLKTITTATKAINVFMRCLSTSRLTMRI